MTPYPSGEEEPVAPGTGGEDGLGPPKTVALPGVLLGAGMILLGLVLMPFGFVLRWPGNDQYPVMSMAMGLLMRGIAVTQGFPLSAPRGPEEFPPEELFARAPEPAADGGLVSDEAPPEFTAEAAPVVPAPAPLAEPAVAESPVVGAPPPPPPVGEGSAIVTGSPEPAGSVWAVPPPPPSAPYGWDPTATGSTQAPGGNQ